MKTALTIILLFLCHITFCQHEKEYVVRDNSRHIKPNPYKDELEKLYPQPDSVEIYYVPNITIPKLFITKESTNDTIFLKYYLNGENENNKTIWDYFQESDSTIFNNTKHITFTLSINWDGEIYQIIAQKVVGSFYRNRWILLWNKIRAIPSREGGILNSYSFSLPINIK